MESTVKQSSELIKGIDSELAQGEKNDCMVRALAVAADSTYDEAHEFAAKRLGRENKKGVINMILPEVEAKGHTLNGKSFERMGQFSYTHKRSGKVRFKQKELMHNVPTYEKLRKMIVRSFLTKVQKNVEGFERDASYLVLVPGHAFAVRDGVIYDNKEFVSVEKLTGLKGMRRPIIGAYRVK